jgi:hypothetical protein
VAGVLALVASSVLACGAVDIPAGEVTREQRTACKALVDALPARVSDQPRRETEGSPYGAAWGEPAIVLRCGVGEPRGFDQFSGCEVANGLGWFVPDEQIADQERDVVMTTVERSPRVEVTVPAEYRPPPAVMVDLAEAIKRHTRLVKPCS